MLGDFKVEQAADRLLRKGRWIGVKSLKPGATLYMAGRSLLVECHVEAGMQIHSDASVILRGSIRGSKLDQTRVKASGHILVLGDVRNAHLKARTIRVLGRARHCVLSAVEGVEVGEGMGGTKVRVGNVQEERRTLSACILDLENGRRNLAFSERQYAIEQRRVTRYMRKSRLHLDYRIGDIVKHWVVHRTDRRIEIDLTPLYTMLESKPTVDVDAALKEFISVGIVESLAERNRNLIGTHPLRRKVFTLAMHKLQRLLALTRAIDRQRTAILETEQRIEGLVRTIGTASSRVFVGGAVVPDVDLVFRMPFVVSSRGGAVSVVEREAALQVRAGATDASWSIRQVSTLGLTRRRQVWPQDLCRARFVPDGSWIAYS